MPTDRYATALKADLLRWLVLDEADRLLDLGFEEDLNAILADITRRTVGVSRPITFVHSLDLHDLVQSHSFIQSTCTISSNHIRSFPRLTHEEALKLRYIYTWFITWCITCIRSSHWFALVHKTHPSPQPAPPRALVVTKTKYGMNQNRRVKAVADNLVRARVCVCV